MPHASFEHPDGVTFETIEEDGHPSVVIHTGPVAERVFRGMRHAVAAMAAEGNNLIVDDVLLEGEKQEYPALLAPFELHLVGVFAPLAVLEARERARGDRMIGLARDPRRSRREAASLRQAGATPRPQDGPCHAALGEEGLRARLSSFPRKRKSRATCEVSVARPGSPLSRG